MRFKSFKNKQKSTGRSMVEMLGVLAIIGVLSIGGIQGYTMAMRKYRANEISNLIAKYAFLAHEHIQNRGLSNVLFDGENANEIDSNGNLGLYYSGFNNVLSFTDAGLGPIPNELENILIEGLYFDKKNNNNFNIFVRLKFNEKNTALCYQLKDTLSGYGFSDYGDTDYVNGRERVGCQAFSVVIPVEGESGYKDPKREFPQYPDTPDYPNAPDDSDNSDW